VVGVAEQGGPLRAQLDDAGDGGAVVELAAAAGAADRGLLQALAQGAVLQRGQRRLAAGVLQRQHVLAFELALLGSLRGGGDRGVGHPGEAGAVVHHHGRSVVLLEQVLAEAGLQRGQLAVDLAQARLLLLVQPGAGAHEVEVVTVEQAQLLGVEAELVALVVQGLDAGVQLRVEGDGVGVRGQQRRHGGLHLLHLRVGVGADQVEEHVGHAQQYLAAALGGDDGVVEGRRLGVVGDGVELGALLGHALLEGRQVVRVGDAVERRQLVRQRARFEEGVGRGRRGLVGGGAEGRQREAGGQGQGPGGTEVHRESPADKTGQKG